jgi:hypothetical protein
MIFSSLVYLNTVAGGPDDKEEKKVGDNDNVFCPKIHCFQMGTEQSILTNTDPKSKKNN